MANFNHLSPHEAMRRLAGFSESLCEGFQALAMSHNINIIAGSMPVWRDNHLYNGSWLFRRDGTQEIQYKIHATPDEAHVWGIQGGTKLSVFDTDCGKIAILICFDCEFPEVARLAALEGAKILFVPFWTDTKNAFLRVKCCAQARAIENECYVVIAGSVGNLPNVENMDIQYAQSAIFSPSDFLFPHDAIIAEATPNTEMTLIADIDLKKIDTVRLEGAVRNLLSRRTELYTLETKS